MSQPPAWDHFASFLAVLRTGSLSAAARSLALTQPTLRRHVEALEASLGEPLFTRSPAGLTPTEAAHRIAPYAETMAASAAALVRAASAGDGPSGTVRLATSEIMAVEVLPAMLAPLIARHPGLTLELSVSNRNEDLLRRDADLAVRMTRPAQGSLIARQIGVVKVGLFATAAYLAERPRITSLTDLAAGHVLVGEDRSPGLAAALGAAGIDTGALTFALRSDSDTAQLAAVRAGLGIGVCQLAIARRDENLTRVLPALALRLEVWLVTHPDLKDQPRIRAVFDHLAETLGSYIRAQ
jgi:DNA-binding transcriptional LysR family regulator